MCNCLETNTQHIRDAYKDPELVANQDLSKGIPLIEVGKMQGRNQTWKRRCYLIPTFCPFCGKKYKEDSGH